MSNIYNMMSLDIYLSSLKQEACDEVYTSITESFVKMPLMSWDIYSNITFGKVHSIKARKDIASVKLFAAKYNWENNIESIFNHQDFEAIIITDANQKILWVNNGFSEMTGYTRAEALDNTPRFLQGPSTSLKSKRRIRKKISISDKPFEDIIINHKKNGETYECAVKIFPLFSDNCKSHYIALERRVG